MIKICKFCNKQFNAIKKYNKFCSQPCFKNSQKKRTNIQCKVCKKFFEVNTCRLERCNIYCSKKCSFIGRQKREKIICKQCKISFIAHRIQKAKFCSKKCFGLFNRSRNNYLWKGNKATYRVKHRWIVLRKGKADHCENCNLKKIPKGKKRYFQWANISRKYLRDTSDYISLCIKCHKHFDGYGV